MITDDGIFFLQFFEQLFASLTSSSVRRPVSMRRAMTGCDCPPKKLKSSSMIRCCAPARLTAASKIVCVANLLHPADRVLGFEPVDQGLHRGVRGSILGGKRFLNSRTEPGPFDQSASITAFDFVSLGTAIGLLCPWVDLLHV